MPLAIKFAIQGRLLPYEKAFRESFAAAATTTMRRKASQLGRRHKAYIARRLGVPMSKSVREASYPRNGTSISPAAEVRYAATRKTDSGDINIIGLFQTGATVVPRGARYLWVPTDEGRRLGGSARNKPRALTPQTFRGGRLLFLPIKGRSRNARVPARLVLRSNPKITVFIALRRVRIRPRLQRLQPITDAVFKNYLDLRNRALDRELGKRIRRIS